MRDPSKFSEERRWTAEESDQVDLMLTLWRRDPMLSNDEVVNELMQFDENVSKDFLMNVLDKLSTFPHMFEVAHAKQQLNTLNRDGTVAPVRSANNDDESVSHLTLSGFQVRIDDYLSLIHI